MERTQHRSLSPSLPLKWALWLFSNSVPNKTLNNLEVYELPDATVKSKVWTVTEVKSAIAIQLKKPSALEFPLQFEIADKVIVNLFTFEWILICASSTWIKTGSII